MTHPQIDTPSTAPPTVPVPAPPVDDPGARLAEQLAAIGRAAFDESFEPPRAPRVIGVRW